MSSERAKVETAVAAMREHELLDLIRDTVTQLNTLGDRLERYAEVHGEGHDGTAISKGDSGSG